MTFYLLRSLVRVPLLGAVIFRRLWATGSTIARLDRADIYLYNDGQRQPSHQDANLCPWPACMYGKSSRDAQSNQT